MTKLEGKEILSIKPLDRVQIRTPGGGGYGLPNLSPANVQEE